VYVLGVWCRFLVLCPATRGATVAVHVPEGAAVAGHLLGHVTFFLRCFLRKLKKNFFFRKLS